ncbi:MAG: efflux RND transporter permease subunit, partial [Bacteroidota bacterium]
YAPALRWSMNYPLPTLALCTAGFFIFLGALNGGFIKSTFFPVIPGDVLTIELELTAGTRDTKTAEVMDHIESAVGRVNDFYKDRYYNGEKDVIEVVQRIQGPSSYAGNFTLFLLNGEERDSVGNRVLISKLRDEIGPIYGAEKLLFGTGGPFGDPVSISLLSRNREELSAAVEEFKSSLRQIPDLRDITDTNQEGIKEVNISLKPKAYNLGLTLQDVIRYVRQGFFGAEVQRLQRGEDEVRVWVRYQEDERSGIADLSEMRIRTASGLAVPLSEIADFTVERGVININHIEGRREIRVKADVANDNVSVSDVNGDIQNVILPDLLAKYPSVSVGVEGQARDTQKTQKSLGPVLGLTFLAMFFVIVLTFKSVSQTLIVFALIPFGMIGVGMGHYLIGLPMSLFSALGVIALIGIFVNDALVFISTFNTKIKEGALFADALYETGKSRFRPIVLTSITTIAGLGPLLLEKSLQARFLIPMAISVAFGLLVGTFILLLLIPSLMVISNRIKRFTMGLWEGEAITAEVVESAHSNKVASFPLYIVAAALAIGAFVVTVMMTMKVSELFV